MFRIYMVLLADRPGWNGMESVTNESIQRWSIPSNKKLILNLRGKIAVVSLLKEVKNIVQTFFFFSPTFLLYPWGLTIIAVIHSANSHFPIDFPHGRKLSNLTCTEEAQVKSPTQCEHSGRTPQWHAWRPECFSVVPKTKEEIKNEMLAVLACNCQWKNSAVTVQKHQIKFNY